MTNDDKKASKANLNIFSFNKYFSYTKPNDLITLKFFTNKAILLKSQKLKQ